MAKGYWIVGVDVANLEGYQAYVKANGPVLAKHGARFLVRGGVFEAVEGKARARNVVLEFPSHEAAIACWKSPEYQALKALRDPHASADLVIVAGYEGPQPA